MEEGCTPSSVGQKRPRSSDDDEDDARANTSKQIHPSSLPSSSTRPTATTTKTRQGEVFKRDVTLHCHDFTFQELVDSLSPDIVRRLLPQASSSSYAAATASSLAPSPQLDDRASPKAENNGGDTSVGAVTSSSSSSLPRLLGAAWEGHYTTHKNQFFPIKNYICKAFPSVFGEDGRVVNLLLNRPHRGRLTTTQGEREKTKEEEGTPCRHTTTMIMECGCGSGSALLPMVKQLLEEDEGEGELEEESRRQEEENEEHWCFVGHDVSATAVQCMMSHELVTAPASTKMSTTHNGNDDDENGQEEQSASCCRHDESANAVTTTTAYHFNSSSEVEAACCSSSSWLSPAAAPSTLSSNDEEGGKTTRSRGRRRRLTVVGFPLNIHTESIPRPFAESSADVVLLIFVLCAIPRSEMPSVIRKLLHSLKPGTGCLCFRDYGVLDHAQLRFENYEQEEPGREQRQGGKVKRKNNNHNDTSTQAKRNADGSYQKGDGTQQYFFSLEDVREIFRQSIVAGTSSSSSSCREQEITSSIDFEEVSLEYHCNEVKNRKNGKAMRKVFVNGVFRRLR